MSPIIAEKCVFLTSRFLRSSGETFFISKERWLTDLCAAITLPRNVVAACESLEVVHPYIKFDCMYLFFEAVLGNYSHLVAVSDAITVPTILEWADLAHYSSPLDRRLIRKCQSEDGRTIFINDFYLRLTKDLWPRAAFSLAEYDGKKDEPALIAREEGGALVLVSITTALRITNRYGERILLRRHSSSDDLKEEFFSKLDHLPMYPIKK